jgi:hypothetical protein
VAEYGLTGRFDLSGNYVASIALFARAIIFFDVTKGLFDPAPDNRFEIMSLSAVSSNVTKHNQAAALLINTQALINAASSTNDRNLAAVATGMAIWETLYEAGTTGYSVSSIWGDNGDGNFLIYGDFPPYQAKTSHYLAKVESGA